MIGSWGPALLMGMTERDWSIVLEVFDAAQSRRPEAAHNDRKFPEALHYFTVHSVSWRTLPASSELELCMEAILPPQRAGGVRGIFPIARGMQADRTLGTAFR